MKKEIKATPPRTSEDDQTEPTEPAEPKEIPNLKDGTAPKPTLGAPTISKDAMRARARRIFTPRANGQLKVSQEIFNEWHRKGSKERRNLEQIFAQCGYNPEVFIAEVEVLRAELYETDVTVEGEYLSEAAMIAEGISENFGCIQELPLESLPDRAIKGKTQLCAIYSKTNPDSQAI